MRVTQAARSQAARLHAAQLQTARSQAPVWCVRWIASPLARNQACGRLA
jgi:hypothetical protein